MVFYNASYVQYPSGLASSDATSPSNGQAFLPRACRRIPFLFYPNLIVDLVSLQTSDPASDPASVRVP